jgi:hypothetical protein
MTSSKELFFQAQVQQAKEQIIELGVSLTLPLLRETSVDRYETVENLHVVMAAKELYSTKEAKYEMTGAYVITKSKGVQFYLVDVVCIDNPTSAKDEFQKIGQEAVPTKVEPTELMDVEEYKAWLSHTDVEPEAEQQPGPVPSDEEQKQVVADVISKAQAAKEKQARVKAQAAVVAKEDKPKKEKATTAKAGGVKSKEKLIIDMNAAELKALAKKNNIDSSTVNFRKVDEKDAFRSKLAKALGRSSELNYSVK